MSKEQDRAFFRNFAIVCGIIGIAMVAFMFLGRMLGIDEEADADRRAALVAERTAPMGEVSVEGEAEATTAAATAASGGMSGEEVYNAMCIACHSVPGIGAPVVGNAEDWAPRIEKGNDALYANAIDGFTGPAGTMMPARGGGQFSDDEVKAAVDYMVGESGGGTMETASAGAGETMAAAGKSGEEVYNAMCIACHSVPGIGAPVVGNAEDWAPRIEKGNDALYTNAINGFTGPAGTMMPARGGGQFSDDEVKAAVDYMVGKSQ